MVYYNRVRYHGILWYIMVYYGILWYIMVYYGILCTSMKSDFIRCIGRGWSPGLFSDWLFISDVSAEGEVRDCSLIGLYQMYLQRVKSGTVLWLVYIRCIGRGWSPGLFFDWLFISWFMVRISDTLDLHIYMCVSIAGMNIIKSVQ